MEEHYKRLEQQIKFGAPVLVHLGKKRKLGRIEIIWWGWDRSAWRWRKSDDSIDAGGMSAYHLRPSEARVLGFLIKPMRWWWHQRFINEEIS